MTSSSWVRLLLVLLSLHATSCFVSFRGAKRAKYSLFMRDVTVKNLDNNKEIVIASGQPLSLAAVRSDMRLSFQCKQGTCQSCQVFLNGNFYIIYSITLSLTLNSCIIQVKSLRLVKLKFQRCLKLLLKNEINKNN